MGVYDTILVKCPNCGAEHEFQSKSGYCILGVYDLSNCPDDVMIDVNRHSPYNCECGVKIAVDVYNRKAVIVNSSKFYW